MAAILKHLVRNSTSLNHHCSYINLSENTFGYAMLSPRGVCVKSHASLMLLFLQQNKACSVGFHLFSTWSQWSMRRRKRGKKKKKTFFFFFFFPSFDNSCVRFIGIRSCFHTRSPQQAVKWLVEPGNVCGRVLKDKERAGLSETFPSDPALKGGMQLHWMPKSMNDRKGSRDIKKKQILHQAQTKMKERERPDSMGTRFH